MANEFVGGVAEKTHNQVDVNTFSARVAVTFTDELYVRGPYTGASQDVGGYPPDCG